MLWEIVVEHQIAVIDLQACVHEAPIFRRMAHQLLGAECRLVKFYRLGGLAVADRKMRRDANRPWMLFAKFHRLDSLPSGGDVRIGPRFPQRLENQTERPGRKGCRGGSTTSGDENAQTEDEE